MSQRVKDMTFAAGCGLMFGGLFLTLMFGVHPIGIMFPIGCSLIALSSRFP